VALLATVLGLWLLSSLAWARAGGGEHFSGGGGGSHSSGGSSFGSHSSGGDADLSFIFDLVRFFGELTIRYPKVMIPTIHQNWRQSPG
jgi:hypothetical protein